MEINLAGMNIDHSLLQDTIRLLRRAADCLTQEKPNLQENRRVADAIFALLDADSMTPETLSAAYARISRDPRSVDQLREESRYRVGKARRSNRTIIFGLGHASVAEHAVFNLDVIGISRYLSEYIQSHRLGSYTEKSQRYIRLDSDYTIPPELIGTPLSRDFEQFIQRRFDDYHALCRIIEKELDSAEPDVAGEDARYVLPLAVTTQMGMTVNARTLERILQRAASSGLQEFQEWGRRVFSVIDGIAPSIIKYTAHSDRQTAIETALRSYQSREKPDPTAPGIRPPVQLVSVTPDGDRRVVEALLAGLSGQSIGETHESFLDDPAIRRQIFLDVFREMEPWDPPPREFELADAQFELLISAAAYAQLKRHRMVTLRPGPYDPRLDITIPPVLKEGRGEVILRSAAAESAAIAHRMMCQAPLAAPYAFLACHRRRIIMKVNARELIHLSRLREDVHAQWDIREIVTAMVTLARAQLPGCMIAACGKHAFEAYRQSLGISS
ncbi:FAD-dependent thymidylate synthase [bacterium]|nr:FAD-dependent thymidylate synthase [candidate division CSSED10-310 bacterium]